MDGTGELTWDDERVGEKDGLVLFMAMDGHIPVVGAVDAMMLADIAPSNDDFDALDAFRTVEPALRKMVSSAYRSGFYEEIWDAPGILRHRRVLVRIGAI
jgi:hypothetical protein